MVHRSGGAATQPGSPVPGLTAQQVPGRAGGVVPVEHRVPGRCLRILQFGRRGQIQLANIHELSDGLSRTRHAVAKAFVVLASSDVQTETGPASMAGWL